MNTLKTQLAFVVALGLGGVAHAQTTTSTTQSSYAAKTKGLSFSLPNGGGATVGGSIATDVNKELRMDFGFDLAKNEGTSATFGFTAEVGLRNYFAEAGNVKVYTQPGFFLGKASGVEFGQALTLGATFGVGGEYWVSKNFSFGAQVAGGLTISNEFKNFNLKTGTSAIRASYYWL